MIYEIVLVQVIGAGLKSSFLWELDMTTVQIEMESVPLTFIVDYSSADSESDYYKYKCHFGICNFKVIRILLIVRIFVNFSLVYRLCSS